MRFSIFDFRFSICGLIVLLAAFIAGCASHAPATAPSTQTATSIDPVTADAGYWLKQPCVATVTHSSFDELWSTCEETAHKYLFTIDRRDFRGGLLTTEPMISKQWFEFWRHDTGTAFGVAQNSLASVRRTIYFEFTHTDPSHYTVAPRVLIERLAIAGRDNPNPDLIPARYWYAIGRDTPAEQNLAETIHELLEEKASRR